MKHEPDASTFTKNCQKINKYNMFQNNSEKCVVMSLMWQTFEKSRGRSLLCCTDVADMFDLLLLPPAVQRPERCKKAHPVWRWHEHMITLIMGMNIMVIWGSNDFFDLFFSQGGTILQHIFNNFKKRVHKFAFTFSHLHSITLSALQKIQSKLNVCCAMIPLWEKTSPTSRSLLVTSGVYPEVRKSLTLTV